MGLNRSESSRAPIRQKIAALQDFGPTYVADGSMMLIKSPMRGLRLCIGGLGTRLRSLFSQRSDWSGITLTLPTDA
jgi:hypothetical protein